MTTRFNLDSFISEINNSGIVNPNRYLATFAPFRNISSDLSNVFSAVNQNLTLRCNSAILPGSALLTNNIRRYGYGPIEKSPYDIQFTSVRLSWIVDQKGGIFNFFNRWNNSIVNFRSKGGSNMTTVDSNGMSPYEIAYKDDYTSPSLTLHVYDTENNTIVKYIMYDVYPAIVEDIPLSWDSNNQMVILNIQFNYIDMTIEPVAYSKTNIDSLFDKADEDFSIIEDPKLRIPPVTFT
jgi:hypothetical protein